MSRFKLSKQRRNQIYKSALSIYIENDYSKGLCNVISRAKEYFEPNPYSYPAQYPEIFKHAPKFSERPEDGYWFYLGEKETRINILKQAINETL